MGHKSRSGWNMGVCLGCCECTQCRKKNSFVRNISENKKSCARNGQKYGVDNIRKLDIEDIVLLP